MLAMRITIIQGVQCAFVDAPEALVTGGRDGVGDDPNCVWVSGDVPTFCVGGRVGSAGEEDF